MKREYRLRDMIKEGILDIFYIWKDELKNVFKDEGVLIFFFLVPFAYPLLYSFIYNNEVVREAKMVVVDQSDSYLSREFTRRVNATPDVRVVAVSTDMEEAKRMLDRKEAYGILYFPTGKQTTVPLYCDMSSLLFYKAFLLAATEVSLDLGKEIRMHNAPGASAKQEEITVNPIPYESVTLFNTQNGFASFLVPAILILVIQQTLVLGIGAYASVCLYICDLVIHIRSFLAERSDSSVLAGYRISVSFDTGDSGIHPYQYMWGGIE